jgi:molybdate transport system regulatory protein
VHSIVTIKTFYREKMLSTMSEPRPASKIWLETDEGHVFGPGVYNLLKAIKELGTLKEASKSLGMSYRYAWGLIRDAEEKLGEPLIEASKGGKHGGGSSKITDLGEHFLLDFEKIQEAWVSFREHYNNFTFVDAQVVDFGGTLVLKIDKPTFLEQDSLKQGQKVKLRISFA